MRKNREWLTETLRITAFAKKNPSNSSYWEELTGEKPETVTNLPRIGGLREEGSFNENRILLNIQGNRLDLFLYPGDNQSDQVLPTIDCLEETIAIINKLKKKWFSIIEKFEICRLALGVVLLQKVENKQLGYETLNKYLNYKLDTEKSTDFMYQENTPVKSKNIENLKINRMKKYSVALSMRVHVQINEQSSSTDNEGCFSRLELDINSFADYTDVFNQTQLDKLWEEFVEEAHKASTQKGE